MGPTNRELSSVLVVLDEIIDNYKESTEPKKRDWRTYEQQVSQRIRTALRDLEPLIDEAISCLMITKDETRGRKSILSLKQKVELLLLKHLFMKSNREMSDMLMIFSMLSDIDVSYKTVERLYSDEEVILVLHNMHALLMKKKGISRPNSTGDGTGYTLTISKHYATESSKLKEKSNKKSKSKIEKFVFSFKLLDIKTRMYIAYGTSFRSERDAYNKAMLMIKGLPLESIRLDKYYSGQSTVRELTDQFGKDISIYLIPKKNARIRGSMAWKNMLGQFVDEPYDYLKQYYQRNQSESAFSEDKRRLGWRIPQRREDRVGTNDTLTFLWHNLLWYGRP
jgi:transposase